VSKILLVINNENLMVINKMYLGCSNISQKSCQNRCTTRWGS